MADPNDAPDPLLSEEIRVARPTSDAVHMDVVRARAEAALFGEAKPATLGRYVLLGPRWAGGMGVVYAAYDPDLDRKVALKVLAPQRGFDANARERLGIEARALAKLDHPNVVKIHDVFAQDEQAVIVMEWVDGETLAAWERAPRTWQRIIDVYVQAARGLAAAHGVGVIHRDFKPGNAILGTDGRVRVLDFGLARRVGREEPEPRASATSPSAGELTQTGDVLGTLAYASPEQLAGATVTPASDQFGFGVALHRALEGVPPYAGKGATELRASIATGAIKTGDRALPAWLRATVARTLAAAPAKRFPSMAALLHELLRPRGWRKWRLVIAAAALVLLAGGSATAFALRDPLATCDGGTGEVDAVWNPVEHGVLDSITKAFPGDAREHVIGGLDAYRERWTAGHRDACIAHRKGEQSAELLDRRMLCLHERLGDLRSTISALHRVPAADHAVDAVVGMPPIADCDDVEQLESDQPPPADLAHRGTIEAIRARIADAMALDRAGQSDDALKIATEAGALARETTYEPVEAEAALARGRILMNMGVERRDDAQGALEEARTLALEQRMWALAVQAAARIIYLEGTSDDPHDRAAADHDVSLYEPLGRSLRGDHFAWPLLLNNIGVTGMAVGDASRALHYFQLAHAALGQIEDQDFELYNIDNNLALVISDDKAREELTSATWERTRAAVGDSHFATMDALKAYAQSITDPARAIPLLSQACSDIARYHAGHQNDLLDCECYLAFLEHLVGNRSDELRADDAILQAAPEDSVAAPQNGPLVLTYRRLAEGDAKFLGGDLVGAATVWKRESEADESNPAWWWQEDGAIAEAGLAELERTRGNVAEARHHVEHALGIFQKIAAINRTARYQLRLQALRQLLALLPERAQSRGH